MVNIFNSGQRMRSAFGVFLFGVIISYTFGQPVVSTDSAERINQLSDNQGQLIIRGVTLVNSTLSPPIGPVDIVVEGNRITNIVVVGFPGVPIDVTKRPALKEGGKELLAEGMYLLPGFVDTHSHIRNGTENRNAEYHYKISLAHGITTIIEPGSLSGLDWTLGEKRKSERNEIIAPRIEAYTWFGQGDIRPISTAERAKEWVRENADRGADGIKMRGASPEVIAAALGENRRLGLKSKTHHEQVHVGRWNVLHSARAGLDVMEHWYGLPEALFDDRTVQDYPLNYNYQNEQDRFGEAGRLWKQAAEPYSDHWNAVMDELISLDFTISPTLVIYEANRDLMRVRRAEWHDEYTLPTLWEIFQPNRATHGSYWYSWGTEQEVAWKNNYRLWMVFLNEYKNRGGRVTTGTDAGFIFAIPGFSFVRELELLREAGFHPLEVIKAATLNGAESAGLASDIGSVEIGKLADFVIVDQNPIENLQVLYGTGAIRLDEDNEATRVGGVRYTVKDGIVYDAKKLLDDVKKIVAAEKAKTNYEILQPGIYHHSKLK